MQITLTAHEMYYSGLVGYRRNLEAICRGRQPRFPEKVVGELFGFHILGAMAECAVAKAYGMYWSPHVNKFSGGDVGRIEVRYSRRSDVKIRERDTGIVVGVSGEPPKFEIAGWIQAEEARRNVEATAPRDGPPAYFVAHDDLMPPQTLFNIVGWAKQ